MVQIIEASEVTEALVTAMDKLIPQLSRSNPAPTPDELQQIVDSDASHLLLAMNDDGAVLGALTLVLFRIPTGVRAWIEDVVVDTDARGMGVGDKLNRFALDMARDNGAVSVDLTSRPSREAANRLYQRIGFLERETNVYRYDLRSN
ncbi:MAG: GNAT family N-acetyltransferase [Acidimicrobiales bacterium]